MLISKLRIGPKLLLAPAVVLMLLLVLSSGAYYGMVRQNQSLENIVQQRAARIREAGELVVLANRAHTEIYQLLTWLNASFSPARLDVLVLEIQGRHVAIDQRYVHLQEVTEPDSAERRFINQSQVAHAYYVQAISDVIEISMNDRSIAANAMLKAERAFDVVSLRLGELSRLEQQLSERAYRDAEAQFAVFSTLLPLVVGLSIALSLLVTMWVRDSMLKEVREIASVASGLARGNLTVRSREYGKDEIGETSRALDDSIRNLNGTLATILASAHSIDSASRDIIQTSADLTTRAEAQASTIEQTASSMQALTETLGRNAGNAQLANQLAACAASFAVKGGSVVQRLAQTMASMRGSSRKVAEIVGVIDGIAFQTGLLARSASVEAELAGEHGRGFAAVAGEVRTLAQRSAMAAREIRNLVVESALEIEGGNRSAGEAGISLAEIAESVHQVGEIIGLINHVSSDQMLGLTQVSQAILQMDQMTRQNSVLVLQAAARAEGLQDQALGLSLAVSGFTLGDGDGGPDGPPGLPPGGGGRLRLASKRG